jgi:hypothetical protein
MWQIRNFVETGYSGFSSAKDEDLYFLDAAGVLARVQHRDFDDEWKELGISKLDLRSATSFYNLPSYIAAHPEQAGWSQGQRLTFIRSAAINIIREHWPVYLVSCSSSLKKIILDNGADHLVNILKVMKTETDTAIKQNAPVSEGRVSRWTQFVNRHPGTYLLHLLLNAVFTIIMSGLYLFAARGLFFLARGTFRGDYPIAYLGLILGTLFYFLTVTALAAGPIVSARYRLPIMPFVCILAAVGLQFSKARSASLK